MSIRLTRDRKVHLYLTLVALAEATRSSAAAELAKRVAAQLGYSREHGDLALLSALREVELALDCAEHGIALEAVTGPIPFAWSEPVFLTDMEQAESRFGPGNVPEFVREALGEPPPATPCAAPPEEP